MKKKNFALLMLVLFGSFGVAHSQYQPIKKPKPYDSWIKTTGGLHKGILYHIQDSTIQLSNTYTNSYSSLHFQDINQIQVRRKNSVLRGAIIGGVIGLLPSIVLATEIKDEADLLYVPIVMILGAGGLAFGAGIGAGVGSIRITIPIERRRENFDRYRSKLNYFALSKTPASVIETLHETPSLANQTNTPPPPENAISLPDYQHESFIGLVSGPSFIMGDLSNQFLIDGTNYTAVNGYSGNWINLGYRLKGNIGITFAGFQNQYDTKSGNPDNWWMINGFLAGPMWTYALSKKFVLDLKPRIGYAQSALNKSADSQLSGNGLVFNPCLSVRFNFARRWCIFSEAGYTYSGQKMDEIGQVNFSSLNLGFGIGYRYR